MGVTRSTVIGSMDLQVVPADAPGSLGGAGRMQEAVDHDIAYLESSTLS
jgi:hypothetical protein